MKTSERNASSNTVCTWAWPIIPLFLLVGSPARAEILSAAVTGGAVEGVVRDGVASFEGIPFAAPPVGTLRWKPPQTIQGWSGTRKADHFALPCAQPSPV